MKAKMYSSIQEYSVPVVMSREGKLPTQQQGTIDITIKPQEIKSNIIKKTKIKRCKDETQPQQMKTGRQGREPSEHAICSTRVC